MNVFRRRFVSLAGVSIFCGILGGLLIARSIFQVYPVPPTNVVASTVIAVTGPLVAPAQALLGMDTSRVGRVPGSHIDGPALVTLGALLLVCIIGACIRGFRSYRTTT